MMTTETTDSNAPKNTQNDMSLLYAMLYIILMLINVCGNSLTLIAFKRDKKLWTVHNYFILNMCIADLLDGFTMMPFWINYFYTGWWNLSKWACKIVCLADYVILSVPSFLVIFLSWDRLMIVTKGAAYSQVQTMKKAKLQVAASWAIPIIIYGPVTLFYDIWNGKSVIPEGVCYAEFIYDVVANILFVAVYVGTILTIIMVLNCLLFYHIRKQNRLIAHAVDNQENANTKRKAPKILILVALAFFVCWCPITFYSCLLLLCPNCASVTDTAKYLFVICYMLQYVNPAVDPFLYPLGSSRFRKNYIAIVTCGKTPP